MAHIYCVYIMYYGIYKAYMVCMYMYAYYGVHVSDIIRVELLLDRAP